MTERTKVGGEHERGGTNHEDETARASLSLSSATLSACHRTADRVVSRYCRAGALRVGDQPGRKITIKEHI